MGALATDVRAVRKQDEGSLFLADGIFVTGVLLGAGTVATLRLAGYSVCMACWIYWGLQAVLVIELLQSRRPLPRATPLLAASVGIFLAVVYGLPQIGRTVALVLPVPSQAQPGPRVGAVFTPARDFSGLCAIVTRCAPCFTVRFQQTIRSRFAQKVDFRLYALAGADLRAVSDLGVPVVWIKEHELRDIGLGVDGRPVWVLVYRGKIRSVIGGES